MITILLTLLLTSGTGWTAAAGAGEEAMTAGVDFRSFTPRRTIQASTLEELMVAVADAQAGDLIEVADGDYNNAEVILIEKKEGTAQAPIILRATNRGKARIIGQGGFQLIRCAYVVIEGFSFFHKDVNLACRIHHSHHCRFTRNHIRIQEQAPTEQNNRRIHWAGISGDNSHHNRIDHNLFEEKRNSGVMIFTGGSSLETGHMSTQYDRIDHNHFRNFYPAKVNGYETIRIGSSTYSHSSANTIVEHNLFEHCDGEAEIISVKTKENTIRHNTFQNCRGMLTLRNSHGCLIEGNYFLNDGSQKRSEGIRFYGSGHIITNNYFQNLGGSAILVKTGDIERRTDPKWKYQERDGNLNNWGSYQRPEDVLIAFNTIINCSVAFRLGETGTRAKTYPLPARNITIANNLIISNREKINSDLGLWKNFTFEGNIFYSTHSNSELGWVLPSDGYRLVDPRLVKRNELLQLTPQSPVIDAAKGNYPKVNRDIHGHLRDGQKDIGAEELSSSPALHTPLTPSDVGPNTVIAVLKAKGNSLTGDFDGDGSVGFQDFLLFAQAFGSADSEFDLDGDNSVGFRDFLIFAQVFVTSL
ncbi:MAG: chondroitinase-B domain-containing protein [Candidatus Latescibacteria bacterium]|nr:chondroitinase-B domain-containing protein [Candidatus Latescibacterota bacterium]